MSFKTFFPIWTSNSTLFASENHLFLPPSFTNDGGEGDAELPGVDIIPLSKIKKRSIWEGCSLCGDIFDKMTSCWNIDNGELGEAKAVKNTPSATTTEASSSDEAAAKDDRDPSFNVLFDDAALGRVSIWSNTNDVCDI